MCTPTTVQKHATCNTYASSTCNSTLSQFLESNQYRFHLVLHILRPSWNVVYAACNSPPHPVAPSHRYIFTLTTTLLTIITTTSTNTLTIATTTTTTTTTITTITLTLTTIPQMVNYNIFQYIGPTNKER